MDVIKQICPILSEFRLGGKIEAVRPYGNGHINDTFLVETSGANPAKYIFQRVNPNVFKKPVQVMKNIEKVTAFLKVRSDSEREVLSLVPTLEGNTYYEDKDKIVWRVYKYIDNSICLDIVEDPADFYECAFAFGSFQKNLSNFPADTLYETIPDFHNTPSRYGDFLRAVSENRSGRADTAKDEIEFVKARQSFYSCLIDAEKRGDLPLRVTHNDTKSNNVMLDIATRKALCVIDLDTVMPGYSVTDFGDAIRFGASTAAEDEPDLDKVHFDIELYRAYMKGFLDGCGGKLKNSEIMLLPEGAKMMTIECGMRFLGDYINGDTYFKTSYPEHNLVRARTQLKLVREMEEQWEEMKKEAAKYCL